MNWRNTWLLVGIAAVLFAFIVLFERRITTAGTSAGPQPVLSDFKAAGATEITVHQGNQFVITLVRTNGAWRYTHPFSYPASSLAVQAVLDMLDQVIPSTFITPDEIVARKQTSADFGFDTPATVVSLRRQPDAAPLLLQFGAHTPSRDQVYLQVGSRPGIYVVNAAVVDRLPRSPNDWRDTALFSVPSQKIDRCEITRAGGGFALHKNPTNNLWRLTFPAHRADQIKVEDLLHAIEESRIVSFVSDDPHADLDPFGLQAPAAEITLAADGLAQKVQFGRSPTNDPSRVYARQVNDSNVVLVSKAALELLSTPPSTLRDHRLVAFAPESVDTIEVRSEEPFVLKRQANGAWSVADRPVDSAFVNDWIGALSQVQVEFVKDVVTDFKPYGLTPPQRRIILQATATNGAVATNILIAQIDFGTNQSSDTVFVRRSDEDSVYTIRAIDYLRMPGAPWQLRDHRVWTITTNQVAKVVITQGGRTRQLIRNPNGQWAATSGDANPFALEETMFRLGELTAYAWVGRGEAALQRYGFAPANYRIAIDLRDGDKTRTLAFQFGAPNPLRVPYAATTIDGEPWVFEFPWPLFPDVQRYLSVSAGGANF